MSVQLKVGAAPINTECALASFFAQVLQAEGEIEAGPDHQVELNLRSRLPYDCLGMAWIIVHLGSCVQLVKSRVFAWPYTSSEGWSSRCELMTGSHGEIRDPRNFFQLHQKVPE